MLRAGAVIGLSMLSAAAVLVVLSKTVGDSNGPWSWAELTSWIAAPLGIAVTLGTWWLSYIRDEPNRATNVPRWLGHGRPGIISIDIPRSHEEKIIGREHLAQELVAALAATRKNMPRVHVLVGMGGSGKTALAADVALRLRRRGTIVWWLSATSAADLLAGLRQVATDLAADVEAIDRAWSGGAGAADLLWGLLLKQRKPWLLVLDDVDEPNILAGSPFVLEDSKGWLRNVESKYGKVLVTSRPGGRWPVWCRAHTLPPLEMADGASILMKDCGRVAGGLMDAENLSQRLGGLPLALRLANSYIANASKAPWPVPGNTFKSYQSLLDEGRIDVAFPPPSARNEDAKARDNLTHIWDLSLKLLHQKGNRGSGSLLCLFALLDSAPIPFRLILDSTLLSAHPEFLGATDVDLWGWITALEELQLIKLSKHEEIDSGGMGEPLLVMHPVIRDLSRSNPNAVRRRTSLLHLLGNLIHRAVVKISSPVGAPNDDAWRLLAPHVLHLDAAFKNYQNALMPIRATVSNDARTAAGVLAQLGTASRALSLKGVGKTYHDHVEAIREVSLTLKTGEFIAIVGPSGCGKTTLLNIVSGAILPSEGLVERRAARIGQVAQQPQLLPWRNVHRNIEFGLELLGVERQSRERKVQRCLELLDMTDLASRYIHELSGGQQAMVSIARALIREPDLFLLDDPFGSLDSLTRLNASHELYRLHTHLKATTVLITHDISEAVYLSDRVLVLSRRPGQIVAEFTNPLPHPRSRDLRYSEDLLGLAEQIRVHLSLGKPN
ncbi:ATP-binding cassette domain-containing protein [Micromonospora sp. DSM 115977]|uniref:ATP-binding cassette domain-containing protein n=1 Tax=Micromonospora reichwaldensis TaxID=3075516 RepID=A0ABU2X620_9ACTN|nr:ATP-binding cassette domain-containing protein [Micromonospora sp. DSM 115977]MDT0533126.1 ATP-binding cassette domain-containing protein [Micromonospora sp. DSM 115977]